MKKRKNSESLDSLNLYFQRIKKIKILTAEEEKALIAKAKNGDEEAFRNIIIANQRLVVREALKYYFKGDNLLDLINEGNKGLIEALKKFDLTPGKPFFHLRPVVGAQRDQALPVQEPEPHLPARHLLQRLPEFQKSLLQAEQKTEAPPHAKKSCPTTCRSRKKRSR